MTAAAAKTIPTRPKITGIRIWPVYTSDAKAAEHFYTVTVGAQKQADPEDPKGARYMLNAVQYVEVLPLPEGQGVNRLDHIAFNTDSTDGMRKYLAAKGWKTPASVGARQGWQPLVRRVRP
ncbi:MAG: VOC family protein [Terracidiphilus sp.]